MDTASRKIVGRGSSGCGNWQTVGRSTAVAELWKAIRGCLDACGKQTQDVAAICIGVAGLGLQEEGTAAEIASELKPHFAEVLVHDEADVALASGTGGHLHGCVVIAGGCSTSGAQRHVMPPCSRP